MGYTTEFSGQFSFDRPLNESHAAYIRKFNETRRMKRNADVAEKLPDPIREAAGLPIGSDGEFFVGSFGYMGQDHDESVVDHNIPLGQNPWPKDGLAQDFGLWHMDNQGIIQEGKCQPSLWCQWTINPDGTALVWDGGEKFYEYIPWLHYLIEKFFKPWGYVLNGEVKWAGENPDDIGKIQIVNNQIYVLEEDDLAKALQDEQLLAALNGSDKAKAPGHDEGVEEIRRKYPWLRK